MAERIRVVIAESGADGDDRGAQVIARALRDAGMEVVYTGAHQTPEQIVRTVVQEDADALGLSGAQTRLFERMVELLARAEAQDVVLFGGGLVAEADIAEVEAIGGARIFTPGAGMDEIVDWLRITVTPE